MIQYKEQDLPGVFLIEPDKYGDHRGYFSETFRWLDFCSSTGVVFSCVQENESQSIHGVFRGLHLQTGNTSQAKLVRCIEGCVIDIVVDLRADSPTFGQWRMYELSRQNHRQLFVPRHFAHGFVVLSPTARFLYKVDNSYSPATECCIHYQDPDLAIDWSKTGLSPDQFILSEKDLKGISLQEYRERFCMGVLL